MTTTAGPIALAAAFAAGQPPDAAVLVPIDVLALMVGSLPGTGQQAVPTETILPVTAPNAQESAALPRSPQPFGAPAARAPGVHLHWAMPDALTRGDAGAAREGTAAAGNPMNLPALPDRWLVVRMPHGTDSCEGFVVDADLQRHQRVTDWFEPDPLPAGTKVTPDGRWYYPAERLTATAGGDVAWAATYDAVVDRFAFHDPLVGVPAATTLAYLVIGWWGRAALDPMAGLTRISTYLKRLARLGWDGPTPVAIPGGTPVTVPPKRTLLHGMVTGMTTGVPAGFPTPDMRPDAAQLEIGLGGTGYAALAAQLADGTGDERAADERLLAAFASGLLDRVDEPDGLVAIDEDRHAGAFVGISAGTGAADRIGEGDPFDSTTPAASSARAAATAATASSPDPHAAADRSPGGATLRRREPGAVLAAVFDRATGAAGERPAPAARAIPAHPAGLDAAPLAAGATSTPPVSPNVTYRDIPSAQPRYFVPGDLALAVHGARRSLRHGEDNRLTFSGLVPCRLSHDLVLEVGGGVLKEQDLPSGLRQLPSDNIPVECHWLLREMALRDPLRANDRRRWAKGANADPTTPRGHISINKWLQPWVPLWCDWELGVRVDDDLTRWALGPIDLESTGTPDGGAERLASGRALLQAAAGTAFGGQIRAWLDEENRRDLAGQGQVTEEDESALQAAASAAEGRDLLSGSLRGLRETLLGLDPQRAILTRINLDGSPADKPPAAALPRLLAGGAATVRRLRIVDAFGRFLDVPDAVLGQLEVAATHRHPAGAPRFTLAPRFQRPTRLALRFVDPRPLDTAPPVEARIDQEHPELAISPIAGWLLPDHVDEALECFDAAGRPLGQLMHDPLSQAVVFEVAPGQPGSIGGPPDALDPGARHVMDFADGMVAADVAARALFGGPVDETALSALLRGIDTTLWTVDPLGSVGTAAVAGLVGRPIAVVRALLTLDVLSDVDELAYGRTPTKADRQRAYAELAARAITVRLGELTRTDDGLLAFFVGNDYSRVRLVAPEAAGLARLSGPRRGRLATVRTSAATSTLTGPPSILPIENPYTAGPTDVQIRAGQTLRLTLLLNPGGSVHVTSGIAPRKALALARDWFHQALEGLSPSFRVGPVLVDPTGVRMPRVTGLGEHQTFTRRDTPLTWRDDPILAASQTALLPDDPAGLQEGWIRVVPADEQQAGGAS